MTLRVQQRQVPRHVVTRRHSVPRRSAIGCMATMYRVLWWSHSRLQAIFYSFHRRWHNILSKLVDVEEIRGCPRGRPSGVRELGGPVQSVGQRVVWRPSLLPGWQRVRAGGSKVEFFTVRPLDLVRKIVHGLDRSRHPFLDMPRAHSIGFQGSRQCGLKKLN